MLFNFSTLIHLLLISAPWNLYSNNPEREQIYKQIVKKHEERLVERPEKGTTYYTDFSLAKYNFTNEECRLCKEDNRGWELENSLKEAQFLKIRTKGSGQGHCFGLATLFIQYLTTHKIEADYSCANILLDVFSNDYLEKAHTLSVNQPSRYIEFFPDQLENGPLPEYFSSDTISYHPEAMERFFPIYLGSSLSHYFYIHPDYANPNEFDSVAIYSTLKELPNQVLLVAFLQNGNPHCIAVSTQNDKFFVFDPNQGLFQYKDLETLSYHNAQILKGSSIHWVASFNLPN